jgi:hypothetical protein
MEMTMEKINQLAERIVDRRRSVYSRAVDLFEFQIAVFLDQKSWRQRARKFVAIKLLEHLEGVNKVERGDVWSALRIPEYKRLFGDLLGQGWLPIRRLPSDREFDERLVDEIKGARIASNVIDFFCSWEVAPPRKRPSMSKALFVLKDLNKLNGFGKTNAKAKWNEHAKWSIFVHLLLEKKYPFLPPRLARKTFSKRLLKQAADVNGLMSFFAAHATVLAAMPRLETKDGTIDRSFALTNVVLPPEPVPYDPLSEKVVSLIKTYKSTGT